MNKMEKIIIAIIAVLIAISMYVVYGWDGIACISIPYTILFGVELCMNPEDTTEPGKRKRNRK